jgi:MFS family permease
MALTNLKIDTSMTLIFSRPWAVALAGMVSLAVSIGIGRFAFTPLLPMMLHDGSLDLRAASWLASANYLGYLVGAVLCMLQPAIWRRFPALGPFRDTAWLRGGLIATSALTVAMALPLPTLPAELTTELSPALSSYLWPLLRFAAGVTCAVVFVQTSGWCLGQLAHLNATALGGLMYTGPGLGIILSGLLASAMVQAHWTATQGWWVFGGLGLALCATVWQVFNKPSKPTSAVAPAPALTAPHPTAEMAWLTFAYGLAGFGYIITATFLPVIARAALPGSAWLDLFWPVFGLGVVLGALLSMRVGPQVDRRTMLTIGFAVQATGVACSLVWPGLGGFVLGSLMVGMPLTALSFFTMQEVRRLRLGNASATMGLLTAVYGIGQIVGPPVATWLITPRSTGADFSRSLTLAAVALAVGAVVAWGLTRRYPLHASA